MHTHYDLGGVHPLTGHSVPNFQFEDGTTIGEFMRDGKGILLDFDGIESRKTLAGEYRERLKYVSGKVKEQFGLTAVLIRPDGMIAWATDNAMDCSEFREVAARWFAVAG